MTRDQAVTLAMHAKGLLPKTEDEVCSLLADVLEPLADPARASRAIIEHADAERDAGRVRLPRLIHALNEGSN